MKYNRIGQAGIRVSAVGFGTWNSFGVKVDKPAAMRILSTACDHGINFFDTADTYGGGAGESFLGEFFQGAARDTAVLATKLFFPISTDPNDRGLSRKHIVCSVARSLRNLRTDYIDLLQCHRFDDQTPLDETIRTMDDLVRQGKILYWGVSRFSEEQTVRCIETARLLGAVRPISNQFVYNLLERRIEPSILPTSQSLGMGVIGYSPLAQGVLTGKYVGGQCPAGSRGDHATARQDMWQHCLQNEPVLQRLAEVAARHEIDLATLAIAWCLRSPAVCSVLTGASRPEQIAANASAVDMEINAELAMEIEEALRVACDNNTNNGNAGTMHREPFTQGRNVVCN